MAATAIPIDTLPSINPATGETLAHVERTPVSLLPEIMLRARAPQGDWAKRSINERSAKLRNLRDCMMAARKELADTVVAEKTKYLDVDRLPRSEKPWWYRYGADLARAADASAI